MNAKQSAGGRTMRNPYGRRMRRMALAGLLLAGGGRAPQAVSLCASVQIQIQQELTLERQAFDARMKIRNGLTTLAMENVQVVLSFADMEGRTVAATSDANNTNALFYVRLDTLDGIQNVSGSGRVGAASEADIHWLIVPSAGAGGTGAGLRYLVGATLTYRLGGEPESITVTPDVITVAPMPKLRLDYFLPDWVYGDDAFTAEIERPEPFSLGVRVKNTGFGPARNVGISSGQPEIVDNSRGLLVGYQITAAEVNGVPAGQTLTVSFGDVASGAAAVGRWIMECTLSGRFTSFEAAYAHSDELGGRLTSLIDDVRTHTLVQLVRLDSPGSDERDDFLALDDLQLNFYGSDGSDAPVQNLSALSTLETLASGEEGMEVRFTLPGGSGLLYAETPFDAGASLDVVRATRWDGKVLHSANAWISRRRREAGTGWMYFLHLFDSGSGGPYVLEFAPKALAGNEAPVLQYVGRRVGQEGSPLGFMVRATDPNGTVPVLGATGLPEGAEFLPEGDGTASFSWTPAPGQAGVHPVRFEASDGEFMDWEIVKIYVGRPGEPLNADGVPESLADWKPTISDLVAVSGSGNATVQWQSVEGVLYDVFWTSNPFEPSQSWTRAGQVFGQGGLDAAQDVTLGSARRRYYQVALYGDSPSDRDVWGVIRQDLPAASFTMLAPPLRSDRRFDGGFGFELSEQLQGHDGGLGSGAAEVYLLEPDGSWRILYLDAQGEWRETDGTLSPCELAPGQGIWVANRSGLPAQATFTGPVGNDGSQTVALRSGFNLLGPSEGRDLPLAATLAAIQPQGGATEEQADIVTFQNPDGSWRQWMFVTNWGVPYDGRWFDLGTFQFATTNDVIEPGAAFYYLRRGGDTQLSF